MNDFLVQALIDDLTQIRSRSPVILNVTNFVAMDLSANSLLSIGASPIMAHAPEELEELVVLSDAVVLNMGTLDRTWSESLIRTAGYAKKQKKPVIFDPVGAGASKFRTHFANEVLKSGAVSCVRGNGSEILALYGGISICQGVDSACAPIDAAEQVLRCGRNLTELVAVSGATDFVVSKNDCLKVSHGAPQMSRVTAMGCTATALIAAFAAVNSNIFGATVHALAVMGVCGEWASERSRGPGSFRVAFVDALSLVAPDFFSQVKVTPHAI